ncbi:hypothetical protein NQ314_003854 [Rhamnusium bicolor]|uniref:Uncharacterized protein n=1 Tax=Rhamnusium bicolor TaxID=1586634 RepID=A0AAV8ZKX5_9CUCU|nr:hypothetical protein NQ314_003854 [Rhamnusium bicolor]
MEILAKETSKVEVKEDEAKEIVVTQKEVSKIESAITKETDQLEKRETLPEGTSKFDESFSEIPQKEEKAVKDERGDSLLEKIEDTVKDQLEAVTDFTKSLFSKDEKDIKIVSDLEQGFGKGKEEVEEIKKQEKTVEDSKITEEDVFEKN